MQCKGGQYSEARVSCTAQVIRNNQNILNALKLFMVRKTLRINPRSTNIGGKINVECILHHPVIFATVSPFSRQIPRFLLLIMETFMRGL